jgi:16S rRNA (cytosine1402-N4)-methyltransferase
MAHESVLMNEVLEVLQPKAGEFMIDGTVDGGGHAAALAERIGETGTLLGIDQDPDMLALSKQRFTKMNATNVLLAEGNYADAPEFMASHNLPLADGLLLDLGFSSSQLEHGRGFSFMKDEPLMMTYSPKDAPVAEIVNGMREEELADIIFNYGEERMSRKIAKAIVEARRKQKIGTTGALAEIVRKAVGGRGGRLDAATRTFQALRIYANREFENIERVIQEIPKIVKPGGRVAIISFHSLEDKIVKQQFQLLEKNHQAERITKKPIAPSRAEIIKNPRSRSAKLRAITVTSSTTASNQD